MPKKVTIKTPLTDVYGKWGDVYHEGEQQPFPDEVVLKNNQEWGHTRGDIEDVIKAKLHELDDKKIGYVFTQADSTTRKVHIYFFANEKACGDWQQDSVGNAELLLGETEVQESEPREGYTLATRIITAPSVKQRKGEENNVTFVYNSYLNGDPTNHDTEYGTLKVEVNGDIKFEKKDLICSDSSSIFNTYTINIGQYCVENIQDVVLYIYNAWGDVNKYTFRNIETISLNVDFDGNYVPYTAKDANWLLRLTTEGSSMTGTLYVQVDTGTKNLLTKETKTGEVLHDFFIDNDISNPLSVGVHRLEVWYRNDERNLESNHLVTHFIKATETQAVDSLAIGLNPPEKVALYTPTSIPYLLYKPNYTGKVNVEIQIYDGQTPIWKEPKKQEVQVVNGNPSAVSRFNIRIDDAQYVDKVLKIEIEIKNSTNPDAKASHTFTLTKSSSELTEVVGYQVYYDLGSMSNSDSEVQQNNLTRTYKNVTSNLTLSDNFLQMLQSNNTALKEEIGFQQDEILGCVIPAGSTLTLGGTTPGQNNQSIRWAPFSTEFGFAGKGSGGGNGMTFEVELTVGTCSNMDLPVVNCLKRLNGETWDEQNSGFAIYPNRVEVKLNGTIKATTYFKEEKRVRVSLVINGAKTKCTYWTGNPKDAPVTKEKLLGFLFMNGVMVRAFEYAETDRWKQNNPMDVIFGSTEGEVTVHSVRVYDLPLTIKQVIDNYAWDTPIIEDKLAIANRNNIFLSNGADINPNAISKALPNTPVITWFMDNLPASKGNAVDCESTEFVNPDWKSYQGHACAPFTAGKHLIDVDGTSSAGYPSPYKNWAEDFTGTTKENNITLHLETGDEEVSKYSITYGIDDAETKFVHKVNFASSEGIFNILAMNMYQDLTLGSYTKLDDNDTLLSKQQQSQVSSGNITYRKSLNGFPEIGLRKRTLPNGQQETTFLSIYNFINNKKTGSMFGLKKVKDADNNDITYTKYQIWEIDGNRNFFMTKMEPHKYESGIFTGSNAVEDPTNNKKPFLYYSRYPSKSPVTKLDLGVSDGSTNNQVIQANKELAALMQVHNWLWSVNPNVAEQYKAQNGDYELLPSYPEPTYIQGEPYYYDNPAYRKARFGVEYPDHLHIYDCIFYFVFCEWFLGTDSFDKNMSLFFDDLEDFYANYNEDTMSSNVNVKLRIMLRDTDTINMFDNDGVLRFKYWHEWGDSFDGTTTGKITGVGADGMPICSSGKEVFNGRLSALWDLIVECLPGQVRTMYNIMREAGLNYNDVYEKYQEFRNYWCEALYNVDALGYVNTDRFNMAYGDKQLLSEYFFKYRERYMDSKYQRFDDGKVVTLRLWGQPAGVWMTYASPMYGSFEYGRGNFITERCIDGEKAFLPNSQTLSNEVCYVDNAEMVTDIGFCTRNGNNIVYENLGALKKWYIEASNFSRFVRLKRFVCDNSENAPNEAMVANGTTPQVFNFDNLKLLEELVMTWCTKWEGNVAIGSNIIKKIDFRGTPIVSITIPETDTLTELHLPDSITNLTLKNLPNISTFTFPVEGIENLQSINIENAGAAGGKIADALVNYIINTGHKPALSKGSIDINGTMTDSTFWKIYDTYGGIDAFDPNNNPEETLRITIPSGLYIGIEDTLLEAGQTAELRAMLMPVNNSEVNIVYKLYDIDDNEIIPVEGIATNENGTTLDINEGIITTSTLDGLEVSSESFKIGAVAMENGVVIATSQKIPVVSSVKTYPTNIVINGFQKLMEDGTYEYTVNVTPSYNATPVAREWTLLNGDSIAVLDSTSNYQKGKVIVSGVTNNLVSATLRYTIRFKNSSHNIHADINLDIQTMPLEIDLGLSVIWSNMFMDISRPNKFAPSPYTYECSFFSWGNTGENGVGAGSPTGDQTITRPLVDYDFGTSNDGPYASTPGAQILKPNSGTEMLDNEHDAAYKQLGGAWRLPTSEEIQELFNNTVPIDSNGNEITEGPIYTTINGIKGLYRRSQKAGYTDKTIFLPLIGYVISGDTRTYRSIALYVISSEINTSNNIIVAYLHINTGYSINASYATNTARYKGWPIRPVKVGTI